MNLTNRTVLLLALCLVPLLGSAQITSGEWQYIVEDAGATITSSTATGDVTIPENIDGYLVKKLGNGRDIFRYNGSVFSITIPSGVTSIGDYAFSSCSSLFSVTIPNSVTSIGDYAFISCDSITSITIPNRVTSIGDYTFYGCSRLNNITIPNSVTSIGDSAFSGCSSLTNVTIPNSVTSIGDYAFSGCSSLTNVTIPNSVTSIGAAAFTVTSGEWTYNIEYGGVTITGSTATGAVTIPSMLGGLPVRKVGDRGLFSFFTSYSSITSITIPNSVTSIGESAFANCSGLTSISIPDSVTIIGGYAFYACRNLTSVTIPNSVTSIGYNAFAFCSGLTSVMISKSVKNIDDKAFEYCTSLKGVLFLGDRPLITGLPFVNCFFAHAYYSAGSSGWTSEVGGIKSSLWTPLTITRQPSSTAANLGGIANFGVIAAGNDLRFQWRKNGVNVLGATNELLFLNNVQDSDEGSYTVVVSDVFGASSESSESFLRVNTPPPPPKVSTPSPPPNITSNLSTVTLRLGKLMSRYTVTTNFGAKSFAAKGLPAGLQLNATTGVVSGKPSKKGTYTVTFTAAKKQGSKVIQSKTAKKVFKVN